MISFEGEQLGVVPIKKALELAEEAGYDLVEVAPEANPPVCKIIDFGKFKYEKEKKAKSSRKKQKVSELKELKMRPKIDEHDYQVKLKVLSGFWKMAIGSNLLFGFEDEVCLCR